MKICSKCCGNTEGMNNSTREGKGIQKSCPEEVTSEQGLEEYIKEQRAKENNFCIHSTDIYWAAPGGQEETSNSQSSSGGR